MKLKIIRILVLIFLCIPLFQVNQALAEENNSDEEITNHIKQIFENRDKALLDGNLDLIQGIYDTNTKYGTWAYEYEEKKMKYIHNWELKQGIKFTNIVPTIKIRRIKGTKNIFSVNLLCSTEFKYVYEDKPEIINSFRIGTYHILRLVNNDNSWIITKEWYKDPFGDSLNLNNKLKDSIREYILAQPPRDCSNIGERRQNAIAYADQYCGAASEEKYGFKYNKKYGDFNPQGGDCANFASQILFEGGKFKKNSSWNYDGNSGTRAWLNADGFKRYMINSGRASVISYGSYEKVYKASYKLLPGDFIAYEKKGDINHISIVTGVDSKGYALVSCHNSDRNKVPWDLGWSDKGIKFWLVRLHY
jgi:hypothetical protein